MNGMATTAQRVSAPTVQETVTSLVSQLNQRLRATADQLGGIIGTIKPEPCDPDKANCNGPGIHPSLQYAQNTMCEIENLVSRLGQLIG